MSSGYEWVKQQLKAEPTLSGSRLKGLAGSLGIKIYPSLVSNVKRELGIKTTRGRPKKKTAIDLLDGAKRVLEARMAKTLPARTNAGFDDAIAVMKLAQSIGGYGVLYDIVDKFKKAGF